MTVFNETYDKNAPAGSDDPAEADNEIRRVKAATQERENVDHYWPLTGTEVSDVDVGEHRKVTLRTGSAPSAVADKGFVYAKDVSGKAELFYRDENGNEIQITKGGILNSLNLTGNQTVAGAKTFSGVATVAKGSLLASSDAPTTDPMIANKKYVDDTYLAGQAVQIVNTQTGALNNITTQIPDDDTIPQITEGEEIMTLAITPTSATNKLKIDVVVNGSNEAGLGFIVALFETTTHATNAIAGAVPQNFPTGNRPTCVSFTHYMTAPGTSEYTFRVRMGSDVLESNFNGINTGGLLGGVLASSITITEIKV